MPFTTILAHVPVDEFEIVGCEANWRVVIANLLKDWDHITMRFQMRTSASQVKFWREVDVHIVEVPSSSPHTYKFVGTFCGEEVSGWYNTFKKSGKLSLK